MNALRRASGAEGCLLDIGQEADILLENAGGGRCFLVRNSERVLSQPFSFMSDP